MPFAPAQPTGSSLQNCILQLSSQSVESSLGSIQSRFVAKKGRVFHWYPYFPYFYDVSDSCWCPDSQCSHVLPTDTRRVKSLRVFTKINGRQAERLKAASCKLTANVNSTFCRMGPQFRPNFGQAGTLSKKRLPSENEDGFFTPVTVS